MINEIALAAAIVAFLLGYLTHLIFSDKPRKPKRTCEPWNKADLEEAFKRVRYGTTTADDEALLRDAAQFDRDSRAHGR